jgi:hypothetical protein
LLATVFIAASKIIGISDQIMITMMIKITAL